MIRLLIWLVVKQLNSFITEMFIRARKLNISIVFITQLYSELPKDVSLNSKHLFIIKISSKWELQQIAMNHLWDSDCKDFNQIIKKCTAEPYSFFVKDTTLPSDDPLRVRNNLLERIYNISWQLIKRL